MTFFTWFLLILVWFFFFICDYANFKLCFAVYYVYLFTFFLKRYICTLVKYFEQEPHNLRRLLNIYGSWNGNDPLFGRFSLSSEIGTKSTKQVVFFFFKMISFLYYVFVVTAAGGRMWKSWQPVTSYGSIFKGNETRLLTDTCSNSWQKFATLPVYVTPTYFDVHSRVPARFAHVSNFNFMSAFGYKFVSQIWLLHKIVGDSYQSLPFINFIVHSRPISPHWDLAPKGKKKKF